MTVNLASTLKCLRNGGRCHGRRAGLKVSSMMRISLRKSYSCLHVDLGELALL